MCHSLCVDGSQILLFGDSAVLKENNHLPLVVEVAGA